MATATAGARIPMAFTYCKSGSWNIRMNETAEALAYLQDNHDLHVIVADTDESIRDLRYRGQSEMRRRNITPAESC